MSLGSGLCLQLCRVRETIQLEINVYTKYVHLAYTISSICNTRRDPYTTAAAPRAKPETFTTLRLTLAHQESLNRATIALESFVQAPEDPKTHREAPIHLELHR